MSRGIRAALVEGLSISAASRTERGSSPPFSGICETIAKGEGG